jgi:gamma-glutamylcyclotransferase (GGCT)/AIG2-like uncharacterized protein YtfP
MHHVFVYGTLRRGGSRSIEDHFPPADFVASGCITGRIFDLGSYPGLELDGHCPVIGEVYQVDDHVLATLDAYEGFDPSDPERSEYHRRFVTVRLDDGISVDCETYEISKHLTIGSSIIPGGDWIAYSSSCES